MNHVTYETAVRLKEAGFPQPAPEAGQFWYDLNGSMFVVYYEGGEGNCFLRLENGDSFVCIDDGYIFAPTATDILRETTRILGNFIEVRMETFENEFVVRLFEDLPFGNFDTIFETNENPAEAAAQAFLNLKAEQ